MLMLLAMSRKSWKGFDAMRRVVYAESEPAGAVPPAEGVPVGRETCDAQAQSVGERVSA